MKKLRNSPIFGNLLVYFVSSISAVFITVILQFLLPKVISVEAYGTYKTFTLYLSFTSLLHFGLKDGIYLKISEQEEFDRKGNTIYYSTLFIQQLFVLLVMLVLSFIGAGIVRVFIMALAMTSFFFIMNTYYDSLFQSQKKFKIVSYLKVFKEAIFLLSVIAGYLIMQDLDVTILFALYVLAAMLTFAIYTFRARGLIAIKIPNKSELKTILYPVYRRGVALITGNFGNQINSNVDKLFVSSFFSVSAFAYYSFGGMFFVLTNTLVGSVATVLLPYLLTDYKDRLEATYRKLLKLTTVFALLLFLYVIAVGFIVQYFYTEYLESIPIIAMFFGAMVYNVKINIVQNNYLKTLNLDRSYIVNNYFVLLVFVLVMLAMYYLKMDLEYFALCTSVFVFARYKLNEWAIRKKLKTNYRLLFQDLGIWLLALLIYLLSRELFL